MPDDLLDKLGNYFVHHDIRGRMCITFERFLHLHEAGLWKEYVA